MKHLTFLSILIISLALGITVRGKKSTLSTLDFSNLRVHPGGNFFFDKSPLEIIEKFNLHALPKTTVNIEFECNFIVESSLYELKFELIKEDSGQWVMEEYEIEKDEHTSQEIYFSDTKMLEGPFSGFRNYYESVINKKYDSYLRYQAAERKTRATKERLLDLINRESRDKAKDGYSELEVIANSLPAKDPNISGVSRIEIEFEYLSKIKSRKGVMKVDFECLRQSDNPEIWVINESESYFKEL